MIHDGTIKCDAVPVLQSGLPCDAQVIGIIIIEQYTSQDWEVPTELPYFHCEEHGPEMMHELKSTMASDEPIWSIDLAQPHRHGTAIGIKKVQ